MRYFISVLLPFVYAGLVFFLGNAEQTNTMAVEETSVVAEIETAEESTASGKSKKELFRKADLLEHYEEPTSESETETEETAAEETETVIEEPEESTEAEQEEFVIPIYSICGDHLDPDIQRYMFTECEKYGIGWFYEYMLCMAYQESSWRIECVTGPDTGLLQYRSYYWEEWSHGCGEYGELTDPYAQIRVTAYYSAKRLASGWTLEETISAHKTGTHQMDETYVNMVLSWYPQLNKIN